jgi:hypothetical protein
MTRSKRSVAPEPRVSRNDSSSLSMERTGVETRMVTPARAAADWRQSTMVAECIGRGKHPSVLFGLRGDSA